MKGLHPICPYCGLFSVLVKGDVIYPHRPDLYQLNFYQCAPCDAYVGCHKTGDWKKPLGRLANAELRQAKSAAHAAFDPVWQQRFEIKRASDPAYTKSMARGGRYKKLAQLMGIPKSECHIGMFDVEQCKTVVALCTAGELNQ